MFLKFLKKKDAEPGRLQDGVDLEMLFCPACKDEFRPSLSACPVCGGRLITGRERLAVVSGKKKALSERNMKISEDESLVAIRKGSVNELKALQRTLAAEYVPSLLVNDSDQCGRGCCGPELQLHIREADVPAASEILSREFIRTTALDTHDLSNAAAVIDIHAKKTTCPACGCQFSPTVGACPDCGLCFE